MIMLDVFIVMVAYEIGKQQMMYGLNMQNGFLNVNL